MKKIIQNAVLFLKNHIIGILITGILASLLANFIYDFFKKPTSAVPGTIPSQSVEPTPESAATMRLLATMNEQHKQIVQKLKNIENDIKESRKNIQPIGQNDHEYEILEERIQSLKKLHEIILYTENKRLEVKKAIDDLSLRSNNSHESIDLINELYDADNQLEHEIASQISEVNKEEESLKERITNISKLSERSSRGDLPNKQGDRHVNLSAPAPQLLKFSAH
jgi:hypothetical protein